MARSRARRFLQGLGTGCPDGRRRRRRLFVALGLAPLLLAGAALGALWFLAAPPTLDEATRRLVTRGGYEAPTGHVAWLAAGDPAGVPVVLVHGTPGGADNFLELLRDPPPGLWLVAVDRPGFGDSQPEDARPALADQAGALAPLLEGFGGRRAVLVGHSLGAAVVVQAAIDAPERVAGVVLVGGALDPALEEWAWFNMVAGAVEGLLPRALRNSNREIEAYKGELETLRPRLGRLAAPVVIIHGTADSLVPFANVEYMRTRFTGAASLRIVTLPGEGHFTPWTRPAILRDAIASLARPGTPGG